MVLYGPNFSLMHVPNPFFLYTGVYTGVYKNMIKSILSVFRIWPFLCKRSGLIQLQFRGWLMCKFKGTSTYVLYSFLSLNVLSKYNIYKTYNNNSILLRAGLFKAGLR